VTKTGAGSLNYQLIPAGTLNDYTGDTIVNEGTLTLHSGFAGGALGGKLIICGNGTAATVRLSSDGELPTGTPVTIRDLGVLSLLTHNQTLTNVTMTGGESATTTTGILTLGGAVNTIGGGSATPATISGLVNVGTGATTFNVGNTLIGTDMIVNGTLSGTGGLTKSGVGQLEILGPAGVPNTYTGQTWVRDGVLDLNHGSSQVTSKNVLVGNGTGAGQSAVLFLGQLSEIPNDATVTVGPDGLFDLNGVNDAIGALVMAGGQMATGAGT
jgi:autotransporter-associated beta strand protein